MSAGGLLVVSIHSLLSSGHSRPSRLLVCLSTAIVIQCPHLLPSLCDSGVTSFPCWCQMVFLCHSLFPGAIFLSNAVTFSLLSFFPSLSWVILWTLLSVMISVDCPLCVQPSGHPSCYPSSRPTRPTGWLPSSFGVFDGHLPSRQPFPLLFLGGKLQSPFSSASSGLDRCHSLGSRENLLWALMPPSTPLPPHPREGADRSPGPLHSRQVPDRGIWGGWHRAPNRALRLHLWLWGRLS